MIRSRVWTSDTRTLQSQPRHFELDSMRFNKEKRITHKLPQNESSLWKLAGPYRWALEAEEVSSCVFYYDEAFTLMKHHSACECPHRTTLVQQLIIIHLEQRRATHKTDETTKRNNLNICVWSQKPNNVSNLAVNPTAGTPGRCYVNGLPTSWFHCCYVYKDSFFGTSMITAGEWLHRI